MTRPFLNFGRKVRKKNGETKKNPVMSLSTLFCCVLQKEVLKKTHEGAGFFAFFLFLSLFG
jgi:hypothetical protein